MALAQLPAGPADALIGASSMSSDASLSSVSLKHWVARAGGSSTRARASASSRLLPGWRSHPSLARTASVDAASALLVLKNSLPKNSLPVKRVRFSEHSKTIEVKSDGKSPALSRRRSVSFEVPAIKQQQQEQPAKRQRFSTANVMAHLWAQPIQIIVDTGANQTVIAQRVVQQLGMQHLVQPMSTMMKVACGGAVASLGRVCVPVTVAGTTMEVTACVSASTTYNMLLGMDWLAAQGCVIDLSRKVVTVGMQRSAPLLLAA